MKASRHGSVQPYHNKFSEDINKELYNWLNMHLEVRLFSLESVLSSVYNITSYESPGYALYMDLGCSFI